MKELEKEFKKLKPLHKRDVEHLDLLDTKDSKRIKTSYQ